VSTSKRLGSYLQQIPLTHMADAARMMTLLASEVVEPPFGHPTSHFAQTEPLEAPEPNAPDIKMERAGRDLDEFTRSCRLIRVRHHEEQPAGERAVVEMGDAALGLACSELAVPPKWLVVRNMSDPVINGVLPAKQFHLRDQTTWAVGCYTPYGGWTRALGTVATWAVIAGIVDS
jgi:hypothetical protein